MAHASLAVCPSNLKEAIDWILRITGKDGGGGSSDGGNKLAAAITELPGFNEAIKEAIQHVKQKSREDGHNDLTNLSATLQRLKDQTVLENVITKLATGLEKLIGYNGGTVKTENGGMGLPNDPRELLGDALLRFLCMFIEKIPNNETVLGWSAGGIASAFKGVIGKGISAFNEKTKVELTFGGENRGGRLRNIVDALKKVNKLYDKNHVSTLADATKEYLDDVLKAISTDVQLNTEALCSGYYNLIGEFQGMQNRPLDLRRDAKIVDGIKRVRNALDNLYRDGLSRNKYNIYAALWYATVGFTNQLQKHMYASSYDFSSTWDKSFNGRADPAAQIFLSCVPLFFYGLTYLNWRCCRGDWTDAQFNSKNGNAHDMYNFTVAMGFNFHQLSGQRGRTVMNAVSSVLNEFTSKAPRPTAYSAFLTEFQSHLYKTINTQASASTADALSDRTIPVLMLAASAYFQYCQRQNATQIVNPTSDTKNPFTIRQMLYFISALTFSPDYHKFENHITELFKDVVSTTKKNDGKEIKLEVDTALQNESSYQLQPSHLKDHLATIYLYAPAVLGVIQGNGEPTSEPWLHRLYSNSEFNFTYPSGITIFSYLCSYAYTLQSQLRFLFMMCLSRYNAGFGWRECKYGQNVNVSGTKVKSWICNLSSGAPKHTPCENKSPLQAFLTDCLTGFCREDEEYTHDRDEHTNGLRCRVKMGFTRERLCAKPGKTGWELYQILRPLCGYDSSPLCRLCEILICLQRCAPKTLSDWFSFYWSLTGVWIKDDGKSVRTAITNGAEGLLALYDTKLKATDQLTGALYALRQHCHTEQMQGDKKVLQHKSGCAHKPSADLSSFYICDGTTGPHNNNGTCGKYLNPSTLTASVTFAPDFALTYLSWIIYRTDDFYEWLNKFLTAFKSIECKHCGSKECHLPSHFNNHGSADVCRCKNIVECADVLPLIFDYGFNFTSVSSLVGWDEAARMYTSKCKRSCSALTTQLNAVLAPSEGTPLWDVLQAIDEFLHTLRLPFIIAIGLIWTLGAITLLYNYLFKLDLLHLRSHLRLPSSHNAPPLSLLNARGSRPLKQIVHFAL